jgi:hypothetical protein
MVERTEVTVPVNVSVPVYITIGKSNEQVAEMSLEDMQQRGAVTVLAETLRAVADEFERLNTESTDDDD